MRICSFDGCGKPLKASGLCTGHYAQLARGESLRPLQVQHHGLSEKQRFTRRFRMDSPRGCFEWIGSLNTGYGQWRNQAGEIELAHRAAWRLFRGEVGKGQHVLHRCDNPLCVNPDHLFLGSHEDNMKDMWLKGRARPGVSRGEKHGMAMLTDADVLEIRASSESREVLAQRYGVKPRTIYDICARKTWKHLE